MNTIEYISADGQTSVIFREDATESGTDYIFMPPLEGLLASGLEATGRRTLNQIGESPSGSVAGVREVSFKVLIIGHTHTATWQARESLSNALWTQPPRRGEEPSTGLLRIYREGMQPVETDALPIDSPSGENWLGANTVIADVTFWCPDPRWRELDNRFIELGGDVGGFTFPVSFPWSSMSANVVMDIDNPTAVDAPVLIKIYGELEVPRIINLSTGKSMEFSGLVDEGEYIAVDTGFKNKSAGLYAEDGTFIENALPRLNFATSELWTLRRGINTIRLEADNNVSGRAYVFFTVRLGGI